MNNARCVALTFINNNGQISQAWFCFERSALKFAQEEGLSSFVVSINLDRIIHARGVSNALTFINSARAA